MELEAELRSSLAHYQACSAPGLLLVVSLEILRPLEQQTLASNQVALAV